MNRLLPLLSFLMLWCAGTNCALAQSGEVALSKSLWEWKREMESRTGAQIILTRVFTDPKENTMSLAPDLKYRNVLTNYFRSEAFVAQFYKSHATTVAYQGFEGTLYFVVLNMALAREWEGVEDGVIAHEFGHVDLLTRGYPSWATGETAEQQCLATQAGDVVQHSLVREEMKRRGTKYFQYWIRNLDAVVKRMEAEKSAGPAQLDGCQRATRIALWTDVRLAFAPGEWPRQARFEALMGQSSPDLKPTVDKLEVRLKEAALWSKERYASALFEVYQIFSGSDKKPVIAPGPAILQ